MSAGLGVRDVIALWTLVDAAVGTKRVVRLMDERLVEGTARCIGDEQGNLLARGEDVRDAFMRVTTLSGFEVFWPVSELRDEVEVGLFVVREET